jgi:hypothetical protein
LLPALFACRLAFAQADAPAAAPEPQVVTVTGQVYRDLRAYSHYLPGLREFDTYHGLAPNADLRFGVLSKIRGKLLPLKHARLERNTPLTQWSQDLPLLEVGWFGIPGPDTNDYRGTDVEISWRGGGPVTWAIEVHTSDLPYQVYRLGDLRLECRVYLAIEWERWHGAKVKGTEQPGANAKSLSRRLRNAWTTDASMDESMAEQLGGLPPTKARTLRAGLTTLGSTDDPPVKEWGENAPPMNASCAGPASVFINTKPWPKLEAYVISEGGREVRHGLNGFPVSAKSFELDLTQEGNAPPWSDNALVEFVFPNKSHWQVIDISAR